MSLPAVAGRAGLSIGLVVSVLAGMVAGSAGSAGAVPSDGVVISQVYGGGGNAGAPLTNDFIEIFNRGDTEVSLEGWSLQYASPTGTGNFGANAAQLSELSGTLAPGQYLVVKEAAGATPSGDFNADIDDPTPIAMGATGGKVAVATTTESLGCNGSSTPCSPAQLALVVDLAGYGNANFFEGTGATPAPSNTNAAFRKEGGCVETDDNATDFEIGAPAPRNRLSPVHDCGADLAPDVSATSPADGAVGVSIGSNLSITFSEPVDVTGAWFSISCSTSGDHPATVTGGPQTFILFPDVDFAQSEECTVTVVAAAVTDQDTDDPPDTMAADVTFGFTTGGPPVEIHTIQGATHSSPLAGTAVSGVAGIVTARLGNGFYLQDPTADADPATSEAIFVFTSSAPSVAVGDSVVVSGNVAEFRPGGSSSANLTTTEITSPTISVLASGAPLPDPTVIGTGGRVPPGVTIDDDGFAVFDPDSDGIDFYESLEAMRVQVNDAVAVGPSNDFGEIPVVGDNGANAGPRTARGGVVVGPSDFNPERIHLDDTIMPTPEANVGDGFATVVGVMDYSFGNYKLYITAPLTTEDNLLQREATAPAAADEVSVATFNVENLDARDPDAKFETLADLIVDHLRSPDVVALEEVQDNNGPFNDAVTDANVTLDELVAAVVAAGGPTYAYRQINPSDDQDGGQPGGNIRVAFLFRTDRGVAFVDRPGGGSTIPTTVIDGPNGPELSFSPGRVDPTNPAWTNSRKPLSAEFRFRGHTFFVIANHFNSKGGDDPLFGRFQPPVRSTEVQRNQQANVLNDFVESILALDAEANVIALGDFNDFEFSEAVGALLDDDLSDLIETLPPNERYTYVFEGNSQTLDHILVSAGAGGAVTGFDVVHVNAEFVDQASDHDPSVVRLRPNAPPAVDAGGPYAVDEGGSVTLSASGTDPEGDPITYAWDLDGDDMFETPGQSVVLSAAALDGPSSVTVRVRAADAFGASLDSAEVDVANVAPTATFSAPTSAPAGFSFELALTDPADPSAADTAAGFEYAFDCGTGAGYGPFSTTSEASCPTSDVGTRDVGGQIRDQDSGTTEYRATVNVVVTFDSLCDLTTAYSSEAATARALCAILDTAERARHPLVRQVLLATYRALVGLETGNRPWHAFTPDEGATLIRLSRAL